MQAKYMTLGLLGAISLVGMTSTIGCGGGGSQTNLAPRVGAARMSALTRFDVDVKSGKVKITQVAEKGRAILTGGAVSFTSSDLLSVGGDSGQRCIHLNLVNNTNQTLPLNPRVVIGSLANNGTADVKGNVAVSTLAGSGTTAVTDGYGTSAAFSSPASVCAGAGPSQNALFVSDAGTSANVIRMVQLDGMVTTLAGTAGAGGWVDAVGSTARFNSPQQIATDSSGNVFVADSGNNCVRRITPTGDVNTIVGHAYMSGPPQAGNDDGNGAVATLYSPRGLAVSADGSRIYVTDYTVGGMTQSAPHIRLVTWLGGPRNLNSSYTVTTLAQVAASASSQTRLALLTDDFGNETLFAADRTNHQIREFDNPTTLGSGSPPTALIPATGSASDTDGNGSVARFNAPYGIAVLKLDGGRFALFITEDVSGTTTSLVREVLSPIGNEPTQISNYVVSTLAGGSAAFADGDGNSARLNGPGGLCVVPATGPSATLIVADTLNNRLRKINVASGALISGGPGSSVTEQVKLMNADSETPNRTAWNKVFQPASDSAGFEGDLQFFVPSGVSGFSFTAYVEADTDLTNLPGTTSAFLTTIAGDGLPGDYFGSGKNAEFNNINGIVAVPPSLQGAYAGPPQIRAFVSDYTNNRIKYIDVNGNVGIFAGSGAYTSVDGTGASASFKAPVGVGIGPDGSIYVSDLGASKVRRIATNSSVTTIAGTGTAGSSDGTSGSDATFNQPGGLAVDAGGTIFITDRTNHNIRRIAYAGGDPAAAGSYRVTTVAGPVGAGPSAYTDGTGSVARFNQPAGIACDTDGKLYVTDYSNHAIRLLTRATATTMQVTTIAGSPPPTVQSGTTDNTVGTSARFNGPYGIAVDAAHNIYVGDASNYRIRRLSPLWAVTTLIGSSAGFADSTTSAAGTMRGATGLAVEASGNILVADGANHAVRAVQRVIRDSQAPPAQ